MRRIESGWIRSKQYMIMFVTHAPNQAVYKIERDWHWDDYGEPVMRITGPGPHSINYMNLPSWMVVE